jgi:hypothetical protein
MYGVWSWEIEVFSSPADVKWQRYEYVNENPKCTATKRRLTLVKKVTKVGEMFDYFKTLLETFPGGYDKEMFGYNLRKVIGTV